MSGTPLFSGVILQGLSQQYRISDPASPQIAEAAWLASPCSQCAQSPCCRNLPLCNLPVETRADLEVAEHLLCHDNIVIGLKESGEWTVFYTARCRFLDERTSKCRIHGTEAQPEVCSSYDPHRCWYRRVFAATASGEMIRLNERRVRRIIELTVFDDREAVYRAPGWERLLPELAEIPLTVAPAGSRPARDPAGDRFEGVRSGEADDPSDVLVFPPGRPTKRKHFDLIRFRLGFPGVELWMEGVVWQFAVAAPARPEAALVVSSCRDRMSAARLPFHAEQRSEAQPIVKVGLGDLDRLINATRFDSKDTIVEYPDVVSLFAPA